MQSTITTDQLIDQLAGVTNIAGRIKAKSVAAPLNDSKKSKKRAKRAKKYMDDHLETYTDGMMSGLCLAALYFSDLDDEKGVKKIFKRLENQIEQGNDDVDREKVSKLTSMFLRCYASETLAERAEDAAKKL